MEVENVKENNLVALRMIFSELQSTLDLADYSTNSMASKALLNGETTQSSASRLWEKESCTNRGEEAKGNSAGLERSESQETELDRVHERNASGSNISYKAGWSEKWLSHLKKLEYIAWESSGQAKELQTVNNEQAKLTEDSLHLYSELSYTKLNNFMLYFCVRKVLLALNIEFTEEYIIWFGRLDLFWSWKVEWGHGKVMEKSLNFISYFQYEPS